MAGTPVSEGPFRPGTGRLPPYLAGRETEQTFFRTRIGAMADGVPPPSEVILYGPRGNGKTALLVWLQREIARMGGVESVRLTPADIPTGAQLAESLLPEAWWANLTPEDISVAGITWRPGRARQAPAAREVLAARARKKPLVVLLDEAHTLAPKVGEALLNASQIVGSELPFLLVLAGTPNLRHQLARMNASFWSRAHQMPINRLSPEASTAAIRRPLDEEDIPVANSAVDRMVRQSHGYPYFLQLWGSLVWQQAAEARKRTITSAETEAAQSEFDRRQGLYYLERFNELADHDLLGAAHALAEAFLERQALHHAELRQIVLSGLAETAGTAQVSDALRTLRHLGFIWQSGPDPRWEPGIPSLMRYIREHAPTA